MNLFNLVVEPQYRDIVQTCVDDLLTSSDKKKHVVSVDGMIDSPIGVGHYIIRRELDNLFVINLKADPSNFENARGVVKDGHETFTTVTRSSNMPFTPASITLEDNGTHKFRGRGKGSFPFPFTMLGVGEEKKYFQYGEEIPHTKVIDFLGVLPERITAEHQVLFGLPVPAWFNDGTISWLADIVGFTKEDMSGWLLLAFNDVDESKELTKLTEGKMTVGIATYWYNCEVVVSDDRVRYVVTPSGSGTVICNSDNFCVIPLNDQIAGLVVDTKNYPTNEMMGMVMSYAYGAFGATAGTFPLKTVTGVIDVDAKGLPKQLFVHDGIIPSRDTIHSLLGEVPDTYSSEDVTFLTLSL